MSWDDPLRSYRVTTAHPAPRSEIGSGLSSCVDDYDAFEGHRRAVEGMLKEYAPINAGDDTAQVLRAFLGKLSKTGQLALMQEIHHLSDHPSRLRQLRNFLVDAILKPMMAAGGKDPKTPITALVHPDAQENIQMSMGEIESSSRNDQKKLKATCLRRDDNRCVVTRKIDGTLKPKVPGDGLRCKTECAHILPLALGNFDPKNEQDVENKATIWWALYRYFPELKGLIASDTINHPRNAMTIWDTQHREFGSFNLAFEPLDHNRYRPHLLKYQIGNVPPVVRFTTTDPSISLPSPTLLRVHFRIAEILEISSVGDKIEEAWEETYWDPENINPSGSTDIGSILSRKMLMGI